MLQIDTVPFLDLGEALGKVEGCDSRDNSGVFSRVSACLKKLPQEPSKLLRVTCLAFPNSENFPPLLLQQPSVFLVPFSISLQLWKPVCLFGFRASVSQPTVVSVPPASVDKYHFPMARQDDIRASGQISAIKSKPISQPVDCAPDRQFGLGICLSYARHAVRTLFLG